MNVRHAVVETGLGPVSLVARDETVTGPYFRGHVRRPARDTSGPEVVAARDTLLNEAARQLNDYLTSERTGFDLLTESLTYGSRSTSSLGWS